MAEEAEVAIKIGKRKAIAPARKTKPSAKQRENMTKEALLRAMAKTENEEIGNIASTLILESLEKILQQNEPLS